MKRWAITVALVILGCGSSADDAAEVGSGGANAGGAGQTAGAGGLGAKGGAKGTGGTAATGGNRGTGGTPGTGGAAGTGGLAATGGTTGTGGTAGTGGSDGGPPHVVAACNGLGAVDHFEDITPPQAIQSGNGITNVLADPVHAGTVLVGTDHRGLLKTTDCGSTWAKMNTGRSSGILDGGTLWSIALDPADSNVIYLGSLYSSDVSLLKSTNGGVDFDSLWPAGSLIANAVPSRFLQDLSIDPTDHTHIVVTFHDNCSGQVGPNCMAETKDSGASWRIFKGPMSGWVEGAGPFVLGPTTFLHGAPQNGLYYTSDSGAQWEQVGPSALRQLYKNSSYYYLGHAFGVNRSTDGHTWTPIPNTNSLWGMIGDGKRLFGAERDSTSDRQPYFTSPESDGLTWTTFATPLTAHGALYFAYDPDHHLLYSANTGAGLWRMVTQ
jgi:hypothetical protein